MESRSLRRSLRSGENRLLAPLAWRPAAGVDPPHPGVGEARLAGVEVQSGPRPFGCSLGWAVADGGGGLCLEPCLPELGGGPPPELRPQQREAGRPDVSPSCWLTSLNPSFLPCKVGTNTFMLVGYVTSTGSHGSQIGRALGAVCPWESLGVAWAPALWSHLLLTGSPPYPCPRPCPQSQRESEQGGAPL